MLESVAAVALWLLPMLAALASLRHLHPDGEVRLPRPRWASVALWCMVAVPSLLQFALPELLAVLCRDWALIEQGQVWRLVTSVVVQDGGALGTAFNLVILAITLLAAQDYWPAARTWVTFWAGAVVANVIVGPGLNPIGAGNSMATFVLATALATNVLLQRPPRHAALTAAGALLCVVVMIGSGNYHGVAALPGVAFGLLPVRRHGMQRV